jgi:hypothetical protein
MVIMIAMAAIQNHDDSCDGDLVIISGCDADDDDYDKIPTTAKITMMRAIAKTILMTTTMTR